MGEQQVDNKITHSDLRSFIRRLLNDIRALDKIIAEEMIETGVRRIGAEQEVFLVNQAWRPAPVAMEILSRVDDSHFTTEIGRFNLEINLDPIIFGGNCLSQMEKQLNALLSKIRVAAHDCEAEIILTGILSTIRKSDLSLNNMTPKPRYAALNSALMNLRGGAYELRLKGADELISKQDSMMLEACCTSFQMHYQVGAREFANLYNLAQLATGPVLAAAVNSPILFGRRLWKETRIPLFEQSIDTRNASYHLRERSPRVSFGERWVSGSILDLFKEDIARFPVLLGADICEDPFEMLRQGLAPGLNALRVFNGTVWRWNRGCYGVTEGRPHLRIEARAFPSGPTVIDEIANAAFFYGLMSGLAAEYDDIAQVMQFDDAKSNFLAAARWGLDAQFTWVGGRVIPAQELICHRLIPIAREGLEKAGIDSADISRYLGVIEERISSGRTGSQWFLDSIAEMKKEGSKDEIITSLVAATAKRQHENEPVHEWPLARLMEGGMWNQSFTRVEEFMKTDLFTVHEEEPVDFVASLMDWKHVRHIPVEDEQGRLVGLISCFEVLRQLERNVAEGKSEPVAVSSIMSREPITVTPETLTLDAIAMMRREKVDCLPVVTDGRLVGIVTERDFINVAARLLERQ